MAKKKSTSKPANKKVVESKVEKEVVGTESLVETVTEPVEEDLVTETNVVSEKEEPVTTDLPVPTIPVEELPQAAYDAVRTLTGLEHFEATMFSTEVTENNEIVRIPVATGPATEKGYVVVSTFGLGEIETQATATIEGKEYPVHLELYTIADSVENTRPMAEELAKLAFFVDAKKQPLLPGLILNQPDGTAYMFSEKPLGIAHDLTYHAPIITDDLVVSFVFIYKISSGEAELLQAPDTAEKFFTHINNLGTKAYSLNREEFTVN